MVVVPLIAAFVAALNIRSQTSTWCRTPWRSKPSAGPCSGRRPGKAQSDYGGLNISSALHNVVLATLGNLVGGSLLVGAVYWFVYLGGRK
jgi:formate transporter